MRIRLIALLMFCAILHGCASKRIEPYQEPLPGPSPIAMENAVVEARSPEEQLQELAEITAKHPPQPVLGVGDVLNISVYGESDLNIEAIPIRPDGKISFPLVGDVVAEDLTVDELKASLGEELSQYLIEPQVSIIVQQFNSQRYTVFGEVVHPGAYPLSTRVTILEALANAGGLKQGQFRATSVETADLTHAFIAREQTVLPVDFVRLIRQGDLRFDIQLQPGDYIYIPSGLAREVYVLGEVVSPMIFAYRENMPMSRTLALSDGFTPDADISRIHVVRGGLHNPTVFIVNFKEVLEGRAREIPLEAGDVVYVPPTGLTTFARVLDKIFPSIQALQVGILLNDTLQSK